MLVPPSSRPVRVMEDGLGADGGGTVERVGVRYDEYTYPQISTDTGTKEASPGSGVPEPPAAAALTMAPEQAWSAGMPLTETETGTARPGITGVAWDQGKAWGFWPGTPASH